MLLLCGGNRSCRFPRTKPPPPCHCLSLIDTDTQADIQRLTDWGTYRYPSHFHLLHRSSLPPRDWLRAHNHFEAPLRVSWQSLDEPLAVGQHSCPARHAPLGVSVSHSWHCCRPQSGRLCSSTGAECRRRRGQCQANHCAGRARSKHPRSLEQPRRRHWDRQLQLRRNHSWSRQRPHRSWHCPVREKEEGGRE